MKTFIKWSGNKSKYIKHIEPLLPSTYNRYVEPFVGSGALFLHLQPKKWIINDLNKDLINIWNTIRDSPEKIIKNFKKFAIKFLPLSNEEKIIFCRKQTQL
jgi:DNA adenine methylase